MMSKKWIVGLVVAGFFSVVLIDQLQSQQAGGPGTGTQDRGRGPGAQGRDRGPGRMRFDPQQFQQRMMERMKEILAANDEEWKVIEPRLSAVMTLSREVNNPGGMMRMFGRGRGRRGEPRPGEGQSDRLQSDIEKSTQALQTLLDAETPNPAQIKKVLTALRTAREKSKQKLVKAQQNLRPVLTIRQEAQLVLMGYLQ